MTLADIKALVVSADANARHYFSEATGKNYTYWEEGQRLATVADDRHQEGWHFYVHRFTKDESDTVAGTIYTKLDTDPRTTVIYTTDHDDESGYIHHIFDCEGY